jgi:hypothetical protein
MFYLRQENYDPKYPKFRVIKSQPEFWLQNYLLYEPLSKIIDSTTQYPRYKHIFLLDDQRFVFFSYDIQFTSEKQLTLKDIQELVQEKLVEAEKQTKEEFLFSHIDSIFIDWIEKQFLIGESGDISCRIILVFLNRETCSIFNDKFWDFQSQKNIEIYPESFQTIKFLRDNMHTDNFLLLYIRDSHCKWVLIENWFYKRIESLNLGVNSLMQMYKDNWISKYRYKNYEEIEDNPFAKNLVVQTLEFYSSMLCKRINEKNFWLQNIFVVSSIMKNWHFMEIFNKIYSQENNKYIVPFHYSDTLDQFWRTREPEDIDALIYANRVLWKEIQWINHYEK